MENRNNQSNQLNKITSSQRPFSKVNYYMMLGCLAMIVIGFMLMSGGGSDGDTFNPEIFSTRRIVVGPAIAFLGFLLMAFAILWKPKSRNTPAEEPSLCDSPEIDQKEDTLPENTDGLKTTDKA